MENTRVESAVGSEGAIEFDTSLVLFFLAMDLGQRAGVFSMENLLMAVAFVAVMFAPYILSGDEKGFANWAFGRSVIGGLGLLVGLAFGASVGTLLPEVFGFLPFTMLIMAAMASVFITFAGLLGFRTGR